jgi:hypothetical protein
MLQTEEPIVPAKRSLAARRLVVQMVWKVQIPEESLRSGRAILNRPGTNEKKIYRLLSR